MFDDYVRCQAQFRGNEPAVVGPNYVLPFAKLEADIRRAVHELGDLKVDPGQSVSVAIKNHYVDWVLNLALQRLGIASAPAQDLGAEFRVSDDEQASGSSTLLLNAEAIRRIIEGPERPLLRRQAHPDSLARIFLSSGTTGSPKRIAVSWRVLEANIMGALSTHASKAGLWWTTPGEQTPLGYYITLAAHVCGYPVAIGMGPWMPAILKAKPSLLALLPIHIQLLLQALPAGHPKWPLSLLTYGSSIPPKLLDLVEQRLTDDVGSGYGLTETGTVAGADFALMKREPLATGYAMPGVSMRIVDEDGTELSAGELGRVCMKSNKLAIGYAGDPEATAAHFRDGWFLSTDLGRMRDDGLLFLEGRVDEVMNLGGHKVLPGTIDAVLSTCPGIRDGAAFSFTDPSGIDRCGIAVVAADGFDPEVVRRAAASRLMKAQSAALVVVDSLPRNVMGKVERQKLRTLLESHREHREIGSA